MKTIKHLDDTNIETPVNLSDRVDRSMRARARRRQGVLAGFCSVLVISLLSFALVAPSSAGNKSASTAGQHKTEPTTASTAPETTVAPVADSTDNDDPKSDDKDHHTKPVPDVDNAIPVDKDGDGVVDYYKVPVDKDGDGTVDFYIRGYDSDGDGVVDTYNRGYRGCGHHKASDDPAQVSDDSHRWKDSHRHDRNDDLRSNSDSRMGDTDRRGGRGGYGGGRHGSRGH